MARVAATWLVIWGSALAMCATDWSWRAVPQPPVPAGADTVPRAIRAARNRVFDRIYAPTPYKGWVSSGPDRVQGVETAEGIPTDKMLVAAVTQFADYRTIRSASGKSIYTEVRMNVEQVLRDPYFYAPILPGRDLTVILPGGSLRLPSGQIVRKDLDEGIESGLQPGHRYLAFLWRETDGDYFKCEKTWDLSGGAATPTSGHSTFIVAVDTAGPRAADGMPEDKFLAAAKDVLSSLP